MSREQQGHFSAPVGRILIQAYREEALLYEREDKPEKAAKLRRLADRMEIMISVRRKGTNVAQQQDQA